MNLQSIQAKIAVVAGACLLVTASILVGYSVYSATASQQLVTAKVTTLVEESTLSQLQQRQTVKPPQSAEELKKD